MRKAVKAVEEIVKTQNQMALENLMLMMRRHEKDFLMHKDPKYLEDMKKRNEKFMAVLSASLLDAATKKTITDLMATYQTDFADAAKGILGMEEALGKLSEAYAAAEPFMEKLGVIAEEAQKEAKSQYASTSKAITYTVAIFVLFVASVVVLMAILLSAAITRAIGTLGCSMTTLSTGETEVEIPFLETRGSFNSMAKALGIFRENLIKNRNFEEERRKDMELRVQRA